MRLAIAAVAFVALGGLAVAQHQHGTSPYSGLQQRAVKALSEQQVSDLRTGRGMGLALAAELNGYPGPMHVLELADQLALSDAQRQKVRELTDAMKSEAVPVGEKLIEDERALDRAFAERKISPEALAALTARIGETQGQLRAVHLKYCRFALGAPAAPLRAASRLSLGRPDAARLARESRLPVEVLLPPRQENEVFDSRQPLFHLPSMDGDALGTRHLDGVPVGPGDHIANQSELAVHSEKLGR